MRRIVAVLGVLMLLLGVKLYEVEPADCGYVGEKTTYEESLRYDFCGDYECALEAIEKLGGKILWSEELDCGVTVLYAYSPRIYKSVKLSGERVNIMTAINGERVSIGSPMLEGSY